MEGYISFESSEGPCSERTLKQGQQVINKNTQDMYKDITNNIAFFHLFFLLCESQTKEIGRLPLIVFACLIC